jgi:hypothetical protein
MILCGNLECLKSILTSKRQVTTCLVSYVDELVDCYSICKLWSIEVFSVATGGLTVFIEVTNYCSVEVKDARRVTKGSGVDVDF